MILFQDAVVWGAFTAVAGLQSSPVASGEAGANDKLGVPTIADHSQLTTLTN
jgi:hypothetical protein